MQKEMAEETYLNSWERGGTLYLEQEKNMQTQKELSGELPKIPQPLISTDENISTGQDTGKAFQDALEQQNKNTIDEATNMLQEHQDDVHRQAVVQWNLKRRERKQLERDLLQYQIGGTSGKNPTDQEVEQARKYINIEHTKKLKKELPYITRYFETIPMDTDIKDNDGLSESSAGSYEACEEWTEEEYRKLMINFNRNEAQYDVDRRVTELAIQRDPLNLAAIEEEYSRNRELLDYRQKRGQDLMKVAKAYADYTRRQERLREGIRQEEIEKLQEQFEKEGDAKWKSKEELYKETLQELERQKSHLQQKEGEWAEKIKKQRKMSKKLEEQCKNLKALESRRLIELRNQLQEKQHESE